MKINMLQNRKKVKHKRGVSYYIHVFYATL